MIKNEIPFNFRHGGRDNELGIWIKCFGRDYLLSPKELFLSLVNEKGEMAMKSHPRHCVGLGVIYFSKTDSIDFLFPPTGNTKGEEMVRWVLAELNAGESTLMFFERGEYSNAVRRCFYQMQNALEREGKLKSYENTDTTSLHAYLQQFELADFVSRNGYNRYMKDAPAIKELRFRCKHRAYDIEYRLNFGDYELNSFISDWSTDLSLLREQLEAGKCVELCYEDSPTTLKVEHLSILNRTENVGNSISFHWERDICMLTITPNEFSKEAYVVGLCRQQQVIKALYEGLLEMASRKFVDHEYKETWDDLDCLTFYIQIKSPLIEDDICGRKDCGNRMVYCRQQRIDHVITISPDVCHLYIDEEGICDCFREKDTIVIDFDDMEEKTIVIEGFEDWWNEYVVATDFADTTTDPSFDYTAWHKRGLDFARKFREQLPDNIDLWYDVPYEDKQRRDGPAKLIYKEYAPIRVCD